MIVYNQIYKSIENEIVDLSFSITFDESQKGVYSSRIADLVLRLASLLESALKQKNPYEEDLKYDDNKLLKKLDLDENKAVYLHWELYNFDKRDFTPFKKIEERALKDLSNVGEVGNQNFSWNNAYQSLRHQFIHAIPKYGNLYYLFETLAAVYVVLDVESRLFTTLEKGEDGERLGWVFNGHGQAVRKSFP